MSMYDACRFGLTLAVVALGSAAAQDSPNLGRPPTPDLIAAWDRAIAPDGEGLPPGSGTVAEGEAVYAFQCIACHGPEGQGLVNDRLVGGHGTLEGPGSETKTIGSYWPYATTLFDYIRRAMPYLTPAVLSDEEVYAVTAYLLYLNGIVDEGAIMDAETLPAVVMPNRDGFVSAYP